MDVGDAEISLLNKLWRHDKFGGEYEPFEKLASGIPTEHHDAAKEAADNLVSSGLLIRHKGEELYSINTDRKEEVKHRLEGNVPQFVIQLRWEGD